MAPAALVLSTRMASLHELETIYSYEDLLNMCEVAQVKSYNEWAAASHP
jgi:hypothetical protein